MNKLIRILVGVSLGALTLTVVSVVIVSGIYVRRESVARKVSNTVGADTDKTQGKQEPQEITASLVASHNTPADCWMIISGGVYNLTTFLPAHPGGTQIMTPYCGREATAAFETKDRKPGVKHSSSALTMLADYYIGSIGSKIVSTQNVSAGFGSLPTQAVRTRIPVLSATPTRSAPGPAVQSGYTLSQVSGHAVASNCWLIISGKVYNVTDYMTQHPGGVSVITPYCGREATQAFSTQGGNGSNHSSYAYSLLGNYFIGNTVTGSGVTPTPTSATQQGIQSPAPTPIPATPSPSPLPQNSGGYSSADVAGHNTSSNCWIIISSKVYNVTSYLTQHPGGISVIAKYCGSEATNAFSTKDGRGSNHSSSAYAQLANYFIGSIVSATQPTSTPLPGQSTPTPTSSLGVSNCTNGTLPASVSSKYPGATIRSQSIEDNCSQELEINTSSGCRHVKTSSSGAISSDQAC